MHEEQEGDVRDQRNRGKRRPWVERKVFLQKLVRNQRRVDREKQRVAIGLGTGGSRGSGGAAGAAAIVDDDILPQPLPHPPPQAPPPATRPPPPPQLS